MEGLKMLREEINCMKAMSEAHASTNFVVDEKQPNSEKNETERFAALSSSDGEATDGLNTHAISRLPIALSSKNSVASPRVVENSYFFPKPSASAGSNRVKISNFRGLACRKFVCTQEKEVLNFLK